MKNENANDNGDGLIPWGEFLRGNGLSITTGWRFKRQGYISPLNISGRLYVRKSEAGKFLERASAGEFAKPVRIPGRKAGE